MDLNAEPPESQENMLVSCFFDISCYSEANTRRAEVIYLHYYYSRPVVSTYAQHNFRLFKLRAVQMPKYNRVCRQEASLHIKFLVASDDRVVFFWTGEKQTPTPATTRVAPLYVAWLYTGEAALRQECDNGIVVVVLLLLCIYLRLANSSPL